MAKPRLEKVWALFYVFQHVTREAANILTQPRIITNLTSAVQFYPFYLIFLYVGKKTTFLLVHINHLHCVYFVTLTLCDYIKIL